MEIKRAPSGELFCDERVLKIDRPYGPEGSKVVRQFVAEGCGIAFGHALTGVRVQKVQRVPPAFGRLVQRVVVSPFGR